jgi:hypothetical protein
LRIALYDRSTVPGHQEMIRSEYLPDVFDLSALLEPLSLPRGERQTNPVKSLAESLGKSCSIEFQGIFSSPSQTEIRAS